MQRFKCGRAPPDTPHFRGEAAKVWGTPDFSIPPDWWRGCMGWVIFEVTGVGDIDALFLVQSSGVHGGWGYWRGRKT